MSGDWAGFAATVIGHHGEDTESTAAACALVRDEAGARILLTACGLEGHVDGWLDTLGMRRGPSSETGQLPASTGPSLADHIIAALQDAARTGMLAPPWQETTEEGLWYAGRMLSGTMAARLPMKKYAGYTAIVDSEALMRERMATGDSNLRAAGYRLTEDVVREAVASWQARGGVL